jgi:hypothetical protein
MAPVFPVPGRLHKFQQEFRGKRQGLSWNASTEDFADLDDFLAEVR